MEIVTCELPVLSRYGVLMNTRYLLIPLLFLLFFPTPVIANQVMPESYSRVEVDTKFEAVESIRAVRLQALLEKMKSFEQKNTVAIGTIRREQVNSRTELIARIQLVKNELEEIFSIKQAYLEHDRQSIGWWIGGLVGLLSCLLWLLF